MSAKQRARQVTADASVWQATVVVIAKQLWPALQVLTENHASMVLRKARRAIADVSVSWDMVALIVKPRCSVSLATDRVL